MLCRLEGKTNIRASNKETIVRECEKFRRRKEWVSTKGITTVSVIGRDIFLRLFSKSRRDIVVKFVFVLLEYGGFIIIIVLILIDCLGIDVVKYNMELKNEGKTISTSYRTLYDHKRSLHGL